jgi:hypothetical protein
MGSIFSPRAIAVVAIMTLGALGLTACQSTLNDSVTQFNASVANDLPTACTLVSSADAAFQTAVATGTIGEKNIVLANQAYAAASAICSNPSSVNASTALQTLANAYAAIVQARHAP